MRRRSIGRKDLLPNHFKAFPVRYPGPGTPEERLEPSKNPLLLAGKDKIEGAEGPGKTAALKVRGG